MRNYGRFEKPEVRQNGGQNFDILQSPQFLKFYVPERLRIVTEVLWYHFCVICTTKSRPNQRSKFFDLKTRFANSDSILYVTDFNLQH